MCAKNADCTCTHSTETNIQYWALRYYESELDFVPKHFNLQSQTKELGHQASPPLPPLSMLIIR